MKAKAKFFVGLLLIIIGIFLGLFVGIYICFYGGLVQIINGLQANPIIGKAIAMGIVKIICATIAGVISAFVLIIPGLAIWKSC